MGKHVCFSSNGQLLASGNFDGTIQLWDVQTGGQRLKMLSAPKNSAIKVICFSSDDQLLASGNAEGTIQLWDFQSNQCVKTIQLKNKSVETLKMRFSPDKQFLAVVDMGNRLFYLFEVESGEQRLLLSHQMVLDFYFSPDGKILVLANMYGYVQLLDVQSGNILKPFPEETQKAEFFYFGACFSPDKKTLLLASADKDQKYKLHFLDVKSGQCLQVLQEEKFFISSFYFSSDNQLLISTNLDDTIKIRNVRDGNCLKTINIPQKIDNMHLSTVDNVHYIAVIFGNYTACFAIHSDVVLMWLIPNKNTLSANNMQDIIDELIFNNQGNRLILSPLLMASLKLAKENCVSNDTFNQNLSFQNTISQAQAEKLSPDLLNPNPTFSNTTKDEIHLMNHTIINYFKIESPPEEMLNFYYENLIRTEAEELLKGCDETGVFLFRQGSIPGWIAISYLYGREVRHSLIRLTQGQVETKESILKSSLSEYFFAWENFLKIPIVAPPLGRGSLAEQSFGSERQASSLPISLDLIRTEKGHTVIGNKYALVNKIHMNEAEALYKQTGIQIPFEPGKKKTKFSVGHGHFGNLRIARMTIDLKIFVAVKKIKNTNINSNAIESSEAEAHIQGRLNHPNIMPLLDSFKTKGSQGQDVLYQFMPLAGFGNGEHLAQQVLSKISNSTLVNNFLIFLAENLLKALVYLHSQRVAHLDIRSSNIVLGNDGKVYIIDFGCAQELSDSKGNITKKDDGYIPQYSPERVAFHRFKKKGTEPEDMGEKVDKFNAYKADMWSLGLTLWEMATNKPLFGRFGFREMLNVWDSNYFEFQLKLCPELKDAKPDSLFGLIKLLLTVDPEKRPNAEIALKLPLFRSRRLNEVDQTKSLFEELQKELAVSELKRVELPKAKEPYISKHSNPYYASVNYQNDDTSQRKDELKNSSQSPFIMMPLPRKDNQVVQQTNPQQDSIKYQNVYNNS